MPETRSTSEAMVAQVMAEMSQKMNQIVAQTIAEMSQKMKQILQAQSDDRATFTGMLEQPRGAMQELKHHEIVSSSTEPKLIYEDEMKNASIVDGDVVEEEINFSHMRSDFSSESVLNETEVVGLNEIQGCAKSVHVTSGNITKCSPTVCKNVSMDCSSYFTLRTGSINYMPAPILQVRSVKPPAKPPEIIHSLHVDDLRALVVNMNDYYEEESSLLSFSDIWKCKRGVHKFLQVMVVDGNYVFDKGKVHTYSKKNDIDVPMFDGNDLENWLFKLNLYFECYLVPIEQKLAIVCLHMTGLAMTWYRWMVRRGKLVSWSSFISAIRQRFGPSSFEDLHDQLSKLSQIGNVYEIVTAFESLADQVLDVQEPILINMFISGLKAEIKRELLMARPRSLQAMRRKQPVSFAQQFPIADSLAVQLLVLAFDPKDRITAEQALAHPYFKGLAKIEREPPCQPISKLEFEFERRMVTKDDVRELIFREILEHHPNFLKDYLNFGWGLQVWLNNENDNGRCYVSYFQATHDKKLPPKIKRLSSIHIWDFSDVESGTTPCSSMQFPCPAIHPISHSGSLDSTHWTASNVYPSWSHSHMPYAATGNISWDHSYMTSDASGIFLNNFCFNSRLGRNVKVTYIESVQGSMHDFTRRIRSSEIFCQSVINVIILKRALIKLTLEVVEAFQSMEVVIDSSLSDGRLDWVKNLRILLFETAFLNLGFSLSLNDHAIVVRYITKFIMFSLPRPPEVGDLEDKVNFKAGGMLHIQISNVTHSNKHKFRDLSIIC